MSSQGRYANDLGMKMPSFQAPLTAYYTAILTAEAQQKRLTELPVTPETLDELDRMAHDPALRNLNNEEQRGQQEIIENQRQEIVNVLLQESMAKLSQFQGTLTDLKALPVFYREVILQLEPRLGRNKMQPFYTAYHLKQSQIATQALSEFTEFLAQIPEDEHGLQQIQTTLQEISGGTPLTEPVWASYVDAATARVEEIHKAQCNQILVEKTINPEDAKQPLLGLEETITLGDFICGLEFLGHDFHSYKSPDESNKDHIVKLTPKNGVYQTLTLHKAEIGPERYALVGFKLADANVERPLSVQEWQLYLASLIRDTGGTTRREPDGGQGIEPERCQRLLNTPQNQLSLADAMILMECMFSEFEKQMNR